jgi:hypothetical protein
MIILGDQKPRYDSFQSNFTDFSLLFNIRAFLRHFPREERLRHMPAGIMSMLDIQ